jgi:putative endonuclease
VADPAAKLRAMKFGRRAEFFAAWFLRFKGYRVLAVNTRLAGGELDLIVRRGRVIAFVEIKARGAQFGLEEAITTRQWRRIARAAEQFVARRPQYHALDRRFDALFLARGRRPVHVVDAWRP